MTDNTITREQAVEFAMRVYGKMKRRRDYALTERAKTTLAALAKAILDRRVAANISGSKEPTAETEFAGVIQQLADCGVNVLQPQPGAAKKLPKLWIDPCSGQPLPPPTTLDEKGVLATRDPELLAHFEEMAKSPYATVAKYLDAEIERKTEAEFVYDQETHKGNVYRGDNKTAITEFVRRNAAMAKRYAAEAKDVDISIAGERKDMTLVGELSKDPASGALIKHAEQIAHDWRAADEAAAAERLRVAREELKKLEAE